jgi:hypothetical protein
MLAKVQVMSHEIDDFFDEMNEAEFVEETLRGISNDGVSGYLAAYGDAVDKRISSVLTQAQQLKDFGWPQPSVTMSVTAIELTIRFLLVRPLIQAAFLSEDWAELLTQRIATGRTSEDQNLLRTILKFHGMDIDKIMLDEDRPLLATIKKINDVRHKIVHAGELATVDDAETAIDCANLLRKEVVLPIAKKYGFTLADTGKWHATLKGKIVLRVTPRSPFK